MRKVIMVDSTCDDFDSFLGEGSMCQTWGQKALYLAKAQRGKDTKNKSERPLLLGGWMSRVLEVSESGTEGQGKIQREIKIESSKIINVFEIGMTQSKL